MVALVFEGATFGPPVMVMLPLGLAASLSRSRSCCDACCAFFSLFSSALLLACAHDQQESAPAVNRIASVFLIVPASYTRSCTSRICVGCDRLLEGGLPKVAHEGCWPELPTRAEIAQPLPCSASSPTLRFSWNQELRLGRARKRKTLRE